MDARHGFSSAHKGELAEQAGDARLQEVQALFCAGEILLVSVQSVLAVVVVGGGGGGGGGDIAVAVAAALPCLASQRLNCINQSVRMCYSR